MAPATPPAVQDPDLTRPIEELIQELFPDPDPWVDTWNPVLGGRTPRSYIGRPEEVILRDLLRAAKAGFFS